MTIEGESEDMRRAKETERFIQEKLEAPRQYYGRDAAGNFFSVPDPLIEGDSSTNN